MAQKQGQTGNPNGRPAGTPNKVNRPLRELLAKFLTDNFSQIQDDFLELSPRDRVKRWADLLQYSMPRLQAIPLGESELGLDIASLNNEALAELQRRFDSNRKVINVQIVEPITGMTVIWHESN